MADDYCHCPAKIAAHRHLGPQDLPGKRRIRDAVSSNLLDDYERFSIVETNWAGSHSIDARAETPDGRSFRIRIEITDVSND